MQNILEFARGIVRPLSLLFAIVTTAYFIAAGTTIPDAWWGLVGAAWTYYFVSRQQPKP